MTEYSALIVDNPDSIAIAGNSASYSGSMTKSTTTTARCPTPWTWATGPSARPADSGCRDHIATTRGPKTTLNERGQRELVKGLLPGTSSKSPGHKLLQHLVRNEGVRGSNPLSSTA